MAKKKIYLQKLMVRFLPKTFERIDEVLEKHETRTNLIREAVEREIKRRERKAVA